MISAQTARRAVWRPLWELPGRFELIASLARRELVSRYKGSVLGIVWAIVTPVVTISIFTFIFAGIFRARFGPAGTPWDYALYLFCGLLPWTMFQDTLQLSSSTIVNHANLVKRVVFPLETLPVAQALSALANQAFGMIVLLVAIVIVRHEFHATVLWLPALLIPQLVFHTRRRLVGGFARCVSARHRPGHHAGLDGLDVLDADHLSGIDCAGTLSSFHQCESLHCHSFAVIDESSLRASLLIGRASLTSPWSPLLLFVFGYWWFAKTRRNFADVIWTSPAVGFLCAFPGTVHR